MKRVKRTLAAASAAAVLAASLSLMAFAEPADGSEESAAAPSAGVYAASGEEAEVKGTGTFEIVSERNPHIEDWTQYRGFNGITFGEFFEKYNKITLNLNVIDTSEKCNITGVQKIRLGGGSGPSEGSIEIDRACFKAPGAVKLGENKFEIEFSTESLHDTWFTDHESGDTTADFGDIKDLPIEMLEIVYEYDGEGQYFGTMPPGIKVFSFDRSSLAEDAYFSLTIREVKANNIIWAFAGFGEEPMFGGDGKTTLGEFLSKYRGIKFKAAVSDVYTPEGKDKFDLYSVLQGQLTDDPRQWDIISKNSVSLKDGEIVDFVFDFPDSVAASENALKAVAKITLSCQNTEEWLQKNADNPWEPAPEGVACKLTPIAEPDGGFELDADDGKTPELEDEKGNAVSASDLVLEIENNNSIAITEPSDKSSTEHKLFVEINSNKGALQFTTDPDDKTAKEFIDAILDISLTSSKNGQQVHPKDGTKVKVMLPLIELGEKYADCSTKAKQKEIKDKLRIRHFIEEEEKLILVDIFYDWNAGCAYFYVDHFSYFVVSEDMRDHVLDMSKYYYNDEGHYVKCGFDDCTIKHELSDHTWDNGVVTTPASASSTGVMTYTCSLCGAEKTEEIPAILPEPDLDKNTGSGNTDADSSDSGTSDTDTGDSGTSDTDTDSSDPDSTASGGDASDDTPAADESSDPSVGENSSDSAETTESADSTGSGTSSAASTDIDSGKNPATGVIVPSASLIIAAAAAVVAAAKNKKR